MHINSRIFHNNYSNSLKSINTFKRTRGTSKNTWNEMIKCRQDKNSQKLPIKQEKNRTKQKEKQNFEKNAAAYVRNQRI
jgi:hypothetical protein